MDNVYEAARRRLDQLLEQVRDLQAEAKELKEFIDLHRTMRHRLGFLDISADVGDTRTGGTDTEQEATPIESEVNPEAVAHTKRPRVTDNPKPAVVVDAAVAILKEAGHPLSRRALHEALAKKGLVVRGANPIKALGTMLWRAPDKLVQLDGFGYWPVAEQYHPAGYYPRGGAVDVTGTPLFRTEGI